MIASLLICALTAFSPAQVSEGYDCSLENSSSEKVVDEKFWNQKKSLRVGYEFHDFQNSNGLMTPDKFSFGLSSIRSIWFHKKPIAGILKIAFDHGLDLNYSRFAGSTIDEGYTGPQGFLGSDTGFDFPVIKDSFNIPDLGQNYFSIGYSLGASVTVNPVARLRCCGYVHFVPSAAFDLCGMSMNIGFMPYIKYGFEMSYSWIGLGVEYGTGMTDMHDVMSLLPSEPLNNQFGARYYSNYTKVYIVFRHAGKRR